MISLSLLTAAGVQILCQAFKVVFYSIKDGSLAHGRLRVGYFFSAGGMPSAHSAFATALLVAVAFRSGLDSDVFAVGFVFAAIVVYDAFRLRGEVGKHARRLNELSRAVSRAVQPESGRTRAEEPEPAYPEFDEMVGHSIAEIAVGILVGGALSTVVTLLLFTS